ncbi:MAG TPA: VOC family protein [Dehalococcoidia bacterium]|nr:VOC family protein [Dehalococcoidia bacterium]
MSITTTGLHHLSLRVTDLARAKQFYATTLGLPVVLEMEGLVLLNVNGVLLGLREGTPATAAAGSFDPFRIGLDRVALSVTDRVNLAALQSSLASAGVANNGVQHDDLTGADYVAFYDPDGIAWELYAMS